MTETGYDPAAAITEMLKEMTPDQAVKMVRELCAQLGADAESFHGNIWPDNIRIDWDGKAVLGDPSEEPANRREAEQVEYLAPEFFWDNDGSARILRIDAERIRKELDRRRIVLVTGFQGVSVASA